MPTINIPARIRFWLYISAAVAIMLVDYLTEKGWAGEAEVRLVGRAAALITLLAAAKTDLREPDTRPVRQRDEAGSAPMPEPPNVIVLLAIAAIVALAALLLIATLRS